MINGINQQKAHVKAEQSVKNPKPQTQNAKPAAPSAGIRSAVSLAAASGLPPDKLSASIVTFAKFFSLPLKTQVLADIRRQALSQNTEGFSLKAQTNAPASAETVSLLNTVKSLNNARTREALSLCAAAAESKGAELRPKGLESYAEAVDPDSRGGQKHQDKKHKNQSEKESGKDESINADSLKKIAIENESNSPLLEILNRMPEKNSRRWIVLPIDFSQDGKDFFVSMRILLDGQNAASRAVCMALDILIRNEDEFNGETRRLFVLEFAGSKVVRVTVCFGEGISWNVKSYEKMLKKELSSIFDIPSESVLFKDRAESFPFEAEFDEALPEINEAV